MSLLSRKRTETDDSSPAIPESNGEEGEQERVNDLDNMVSRKKKKRRQAELRKQQKEDEKKIKGLENLLFGSLYSPLEFRGNPSDEGLDEDDESKNGKLPLGVFLDCSADGRMAMDADEDENDEEDDDDHDGSDEEADDNDKVLNRQDPYLHKVVDNDEEQGLEEPRKPAWVDEEEEKATVNIVKVKRLRKLRKEEDESVISGTTYVSRLRSYHAKMNPGTEWANLDGKERVYDSSEEDESEVENDILRSSEDLVVKNTTKILPGILGYSRLVDANSVDPSDAPINTVQFHREGKLLLTAGLDRKLRFFQIDGKRNPRVDSVFIEDCPVRKAAFLPDGSEVIVSGRRKFFYSFNIVKGMYDKVGPLTGREEKSLETFEVSPDSSTIAFLGNEGYILLVSTKSKELIGSLKMNGTARSIAFTPDGKQLLSSGGDGQVYTWDLRTRTCIHKGYDDGCLTGTALCTSPVGNLFAAGSSSGIVNVYNRENFILGGGGGNKKKPLKTIENLTTKVDFMKFNHDAQILAICSGMKKSSLKLVHIPTFTVFSNWPPPTANLHYPRCLDFSPGGGFMTIGNAEGKVMLYRLHNYHNA